MLQVFEFTEEVELFEIRFLRTFRLAFSTRPAFTDEWFRPYGGGRARMLSIVQVRS